MHVLSFYIFNSKEFRDSFSLSDQVGCSGSKGVHPPAAVYCILPDYHLWILVHAVDLHLEWKAEKAC